MHNIIQSVAMLIFKMKKADIIPVSSGVNTIDELFDDIIRKDYKSVFIASGKTIRNKGMLDRLTDKLNSNGVKTCVFSDIVPDPTIENVEAGLKYYKENKCSCIIAAGGGSVLDCAKVIALRAANPLVSVAMMAMYVVPCRKSVPLYAVPTTSGTGSEITFFSVITDTKKKKKLAVLSDKYMPEKIIFDYELLRHVPENPTVYHTNKKVKINYSGLYPGNSYILKIIAKEISSGQKFKASNVIFTTPLIYPSTVNDLSVKLDADEKLPKNFELSFTAPTTWPVTRFKKCYRLVLLVNGKPVAYNDTILKAGSSYSGKKINIGQITSKNNIFTFPNK